jgi:hypothetical protein
VVTRYDARQREGDVLSGHDRAELPGPRGLSDQTAELLAQKAKPLLQHQKKLLSRAMRA